MNMNGEAVNAALALAGNQPLTEADKASGNSVYVLCRGLYLPVLFASLGEIDWRSARKHGELRETLRYVDRVPGHYYYEMPADCIRPLVVDENETEFRNDTHFIITRRPAARLYYVFHKRNLNRYSFDIADTAARRDNTVYLRRSDGPDINNHLIYFRGNRPENESDDDFPEWEYTAYEPDLWQYFTYRMAARLVPRLRADDGAAGRAQALEAAAARIGEEAIQRDKAAASSPRGSFRHGRKNAGWSPGTAARIIRRRTIRGASGLQE